MLKYFLAAVAPSPSHHRAPSKDDDGTPDQGPDVVLMDISMPGTTASRRIGVTDRTSAALWARDHLA